MCNLETIEKHPRTLSSLRLSLSVTKREVQEQFFLIFLKKEEPLYCVSSYISDIYKYTYI